MPLGLLKLGFILHSIVIQHGVLLIIINVQEILFQFLFLFDFFGHARLDRDEIFCSFVNGTAFCYQAKFVAALVVITEHAENVLVFELHRN